LQEGSFLVDAYDFETPAAFGDEVEAAVRILLDHSDNFGSASHLGQTLFDYAHYTERAMLGEALSDHFFIAELEDVQGQGDAGEQDDIEREQGEKGFQEGSPLASAIDDKGRAVS
jgi:hypothetical protein